MAAITYDTNATTATDVACYYLYIDSNLTATASTGYVVFRQEVDQKYLEILANEEYNRSTWTRDRIHFSPKYHNHYKLINTKIIRNFSSRAQYARQKRKDYLQA